MDLKELFTQKGELMTNIEIDNAKLMLVNKKISDIVAARDAMPSGNGSYKKEAVEDKK